MKAPTTSIDFSAIKSALRDSVAAGCSREDLIQAMRKAGLNQIACIKMLRDLCGISLGDAKEAVHYSRAWADRRESNEALHEAAFEALDELGLVEING